MRRQLAWVAAIVVAGCSTAPAYPPLACDPEAAGEMVFGYQQGGAYFPWEGQDANGSDFLFIDGACRYWTSGSHASRVITGTLTGDELAAINDELLTHDWLAIDGEHVSGCCDGETIGLARDDIRASRYDFSSGSSETFEILFRAARGWSDRLALSGSRVANDAPLRVEMRSNAGSSSAIAWPLDVPLSELAPSASHLSTVHVFDGSDAATLRGLSTGSVTDGTIHVFAVTVDVVPFADAEGCLRPLFPGPCRIPLR